MSRCEVCARPLSKRTRGTVCAICRMAGAAFARAWMAELDAVDVPRSSIAVIVGTTPDVVRTRLSERKAAA